MLCNPRTQREYQTLEKMLKIYCQGHHNCMTELCSNCLQLLDYAKQRLAKCPFQERKPTCANCPIHCYKPGMRDRVKQVMRYSGPRMLLKHPVMAIMHLLDGYKKVEQQKFQSKG